MTADNLSQTVSKLSERLEELQAKCVSNPADAPEILSDALESLQASLEVISSADEELMQQNEELLEATEENGRLLAAVQEEHDKLSALVNSISDEVWFVDTQRKFTLTNPSALREFSPASGDVDVKKLAASLEVFRPDGSPRPVEEAPPLRALQGDVVRNQEEIIRTPSTNELRYRQVNSSPVKDAKGNTIGSVSVVRDITERKQMEVELDWLASFPKINPNPIIEVDLEGYVHFINPAAKKLFPGLQERGPNHPWLTDWGQMMQIFRKSGASTYVRDLLIDDKWYQQSMYFVPDIQRIRIYGLDITGHKKAEIALQEANEELEATGEELRQQNDEIMRAQSALQESEEKYRTIVETANEGIWVVDSETQTTYVNKRMAEMLGYSPEEMIGKKSSEFMDEEYKAYLELMLERRRQLIEESIEVKFFRKDGSFLWALSNASPFRDRDGKFAGSMGMLTDITERKRTEDALQEAKDQLEMRVKERTSELEQANFRQQEEIAERKKAEEALRTAWAYNRSLIEASLDPLVTIGPDGKITDVNVATKSVTGYRFEELVGTDFSDYFTEPENARAGYEKVFKEGYVRDYPLTIRHRDGRLTDVLYNASIYKDIQGNVLGVFAAARDITERRRAEVELDKYRSHLEDLVIVRTFKLEAANAQLLAEITERKRMEEELRKSKDELEQKVNERTEDLFKANEKLQVEIAEHQKARKAAEAAAEAKAAFLANMSHELRTPLNAVIGFSSLLLDDNLTQTQKEYIDSIRNGGQALLSIISDILELSKTEKEKITLERQPFSLKHCIEEAMDLVALQAEQKGLSMVSAISYGTPDTIISDHGRLRQVLVNLLSNAVKFTDTGDISVSVSSKVLEGNKRQITFAVKDAGIGMPQDKMDRLFKPFSQLEYVISRKRDGAGLGLAICKKHVGLLGGEIWAESEEGIGSTFRFTIQAEAIPGKQLDLKEKNRTAAYESLSGKKPLAILVADDIPSNQKVLVEMLKGIGYRADAVADGIEVLQALQIRPYDLILMDIRMPKMDGLTATKEIRRLWPNNGPKVIAITAFAMEGDKEKFLEAGMDGYIAKPVKVDDLVTLLCSITSS